MLARLNEQLAWAAGADRQVSGFDERARRQAGMPGVLGKDVPGREFTLRAER